MPVKKQDVLRALSLLKEYHGQLVTVQDKPLRAAVEHIILIFKGQLFQALLDVQEYYELTLLNDIKSVQQTVLETLETVVKRETELPTKPHQLMTSFNNYSAVSEEPLPPLPPPLDDVDQQLYKTVEPKSFAPVIKRDESGDKWNCEEITLEREAAGLGFSIAGGTDVPHIDNDPSIYVTKVITGGAAFVDGRLRTNDIIVSVNGISAVNITHAQSVEALKNAGRTVQLVVKRLCMSSKEDVIQIDLVKSSKGLGFSIAGGVGNQHIQDDNGIFVTKVIDGGAAQQDGRLAVGDRLLAVNDVHLENVTHETAVGALKTTKEHVKLMVTKPHLTILEASPSTDQKHANTYSISNDILPSDSTVNDKIIRSLRKVILRKGPTGFGFNIVGGEDGEGIFVSFIMSGGPAYLSGQLHKGDQLISVNGIDIQEATHEQAAAALKGAGEVVDITLQYKPDEYRQFEAKIKDLREQMIIATTGGSVPKTAKKRGFFVRALYDYDPSKDGGMPGRGLHFHFGDVLHVVNNVDEEEWWQAQKVFPEEDVIGYIPSKRRLEMNEKTRMRSINDLKKKKLKKSKKTDDQGGLNVQFNSKDDVDQLVLSYQSVMRKESNYVRPLIILGPLKDKIYDALISEFPDAFGSCIPHTTRPKKEHEVDGRDYHFVASREEMERDIENHLFVEAGQYGDNLYGTNVQSVKDVAESGKHCILDIGASAILRLQAVGLYAITIFIKPKSVESVMQWNIGEEDAKEMFDKATHIEKEFREHFTAVVAKETPDDIFCEVKRVIEQHSGPFIWMSSDIGQY